MNTLIIAIFVFIPVSLKNKGADSTHPVLGTAKRLSRKCAKPRRVAAWFLEGIGNSRFQDSPVAKSYKICFVVLSVSMVFTPFASGFQAVFSKMRKHKEVSKAKRWETPK